jgi:hypothetical protein
MRNVENKAPADILRSQLHARFYGPLMTFFLRRIRDHAEAEDLAQDVLLRVVPPQVWAANTPILGTPYHSQDITVAAVPPANMHPTAWVNGYYDIDFTKSEAQEYINSIAKVVAD